MDLLLKCLIVTGAISILFILSKILGFIYIYLRPSSLNRYHHNHIHSSATPWAIVTGANDGIGKGFAYALADHDFNVVLHGRNSTKLHNVRHEFQNEFPHLSFRIVLADAAQSGPETQKHINDIADSLRDLHVTVLINNVGTVSKPHGPEFSPFWQEIPEDIDALINVNARFPAQFTRAILPLLLSHGGPALILNMGSMADFGFPYMSMYSASKKFDMVFSSALKEEMRKEGKNVEVLGITCADVVGTTHDKNKSSLLRPDSRTYARAALNRVGCGEAVVCGWWVHGVMWWFGALLPQWVFNNLSKPMEKYHRDKYAKAA
jgi:17beta-estradiol 17-dehydrogenase / very-long-chain 3-oxoacyl-CoA reductase